MKATVSLYGKPSGDRHKGGVAVTNRTRRTTPRFAYDTVASAAAPGWEVSLAFVTPKEAQRINMVLREKEYVPNVLSYVVGEKSGEIVICLAEAARQAPDFDMDPSTFVLFLFIHGCLHLIGGRHSATMERRERKLLAQFAKVGARTPLSHVTTHRSRNRYRNLPGKNGGGRRAPR